MYLRQIYVSYGFCHLMNSVVLNFFVMLDCGTLGFEQCLGPKNLPLYPWLAFRHKFAQR